MFAGHYGVSFIAKKADPSIPLWVLFLATQWLDIIWAPLVLLGVEKVRIVPGFTATSPLDLYYMPYTHSLVAAVLWSVGVAGAYRVLRRSEARTSVVVGLVVFSHWVLDLVSHSPDLPIYDNTAKVGLGLWNHPVWSSGIEATLLLGAVAAYIRGRPTHRTAILIFSVVMLGIQAYLSFGPPLPSPASTAGAALGAYVAFAFVIWFIADRPEAMKAV